MEHARLLGELCSDDLAFFDLRQRQVHVPDRQREIGYRRFVFGERLLRVAECFQHFMQRIEERAECRRVALAVVFRFSLHAHPPRHDVAFEAKSAVFFVRRAIELRNFGSDLKSRR
jgi:hypothetical protein